MHIVVVRKELLERHMKIVTASATPATQNSW